jgi:hypothetical protein
MKFIDYVGLRDRGIPGSKVTIWRKERENRFPRRTRFSAKYYGWPDSVIDTYLVALAAGHEETTATAIAERARPTQTEAASPMLQIRKPAGEGEASDGSVHAAKLNTSEPMWSTEPHQVVHGCPRESSASSAVEAAR